MKKMFLILLFLFFVTGCVAAETPIETNNTTPMPSEPTPTPEIDPTLSDAFIFYKAFLDDTIMDPMINPAVIYDFPDHLTSIAKTDFMDTYLSLDQNFVRTDYYNALVTDNIFHFDRFIEACDLLGTETSCMTNVTHHDGDYHVLLSADLVHDRLTVEIKLTYTLGPDVISKVYHRFITFDQIDGNVSIEYAEIFYDYSGESRTLSRIIYGEIIENEAFNFIIRSFDTANSINSTMLHQADLINQTYVVYSYDQEGQTLFQLYNPEEAYFLHMTLDYDDITLMDLHILEGSNVILKYEEFYLSQNARLFWNLLEVDQWTHLLCEDCGIYPLGLKIGETTLLNTHTRLMFYNPNKRNPLFLMREVTDMTESFVSLNDLGLDFTKVSADDLLTKIDYIRNNYEAMMLASGFIFGETDNITLYDDILADYLLKSMDSSE